MDARELELWTSPYLLQVEPRLSVRTSLHLSFVAPVPCTQSAGSGQATGSLPSRRRTRTAFALEKRSRPLASACESVWSGLFLLSGVAGRCWEASDCQHEGKRHVPGLAVLVPYACRGAGQPPVQRGCLACSPAEVLTEPPAFLLGTVLGTRALPTLNKNLKILSGIYQNSCHRVNFMMLGSDPIPRTEVQHWAALEFPGGGRVVKI